MKSKFFRTLPIFAVLFFAFLAGFSLLKPGLPPTHDGEYHIIRFYEFDKVLREGNIYPRWAPDLNNGYGVPLFNYVYPLPNYVASFLHFLGFSFIDSFKLQMFIAILIGAIFFYLFSKQFFGALGGVVASVFYTFSPYHFVDIYIRGSVGEVWALAIFPGFLWSVTRFIREKNKTYVLLSSLLLALTIFSHNILALMFFIFSIFYILFLIYQTKEKKYYILNTLYIILIGLGLSSIFWLPALLEESYVAGLKIYNIRENFPDLYQLLIPSWGTGFSGSELGNQMSFQIGVANLLAVLLSFIILIKSFFKKESKKYLLLFFLISFIFVFFLLLESSLIIWEKAPFMTFFQFPWRLLSIEILISSFLAGSIIYITKSKIIASFLVLFAIVLTLGYTKPAYYHQRDDKYYITKSNFIDGTNSIGSYFNTIWFDKNLKKQQRKVQPEGLGENSVVEKEIKSQNYKFNVKTDRSKEIVLNTAYFPGWTIFINGKREKTFYTADGLLKFNIPSGTSSVEIKLANTFVRGLAALVSLLSFITVIILLGFFSNLKNQQFSKKK